MNEICGTVIHQPKFSLYTEDGNCLSICQFLIECNHDVFPIVCFERIAENILKKIKIGDSVNITGIFKNYSYRDFNYTTHYTKIFIAKEILIVDSNSITRSNMSEQLESIYENLLNKKISLLDIREYEKYAEACRINQIGGDCNA